MAAEKKAIILAPGDPGYAELLDKTEIALRSFCSAAQLLSQIVDPAAILNGMLSAYINIARVCGVTPESCRAVLCDTAASIDAAYATLDAREKLEAAEPQGRA